jgi:primosomal protein N'
MAKRRGFYREQLIIQSKNRSMLQATLKQLSLSLIKLTKKRIRYSLDVDPIDLT